MPNDYYPIPDNYPTYHAKLSKVTDGRRFSFYALADSFFIVIGLLLSLWLAVLLLWDSLTLSPRMIFLLTLSWVLIAYLMLPRLHQLFTLIYVPDYFIGRTKTTDGLLGDPVNLAFDGTDADIHQAMKDAGWTLADPITLLSSWRIIISSVFRKSYPEAPVSNLLLFGRAQDFAYQQEVEGSASKRHHVRFWKVPDGWVLPGGHRAGWLAAGTYDRAVGFSAFTFQITHKIDADTDLERDYIISTLRYTNKKIKVRVIEDFSTAYHHRNGGGDTITTDGNLPVVNVTGIAKVQQDSAGTTGYRSAAYQRRLARDHQVPPPGLLAAGLFIVLNMLFLSQAWAGGKSTGVEQLNEGETLSLWVILFELFTHLIFWIYTLQHYRFARIGLMVIATLSAIRSLLELMDNPGSFVSVSMTFFAVFVVLAVSGDATRLWVEKESLSKLPATRSI